MDRYTVDELGAETGLPTSTIRLYRQRGLIQPPEREGRKAYYGPAHLEQLEIIARLKLRGYSLAAIGEMLDLWRGGESLENILEHESAERPVLELNELLALLFANGEVDMDLVARATALGLLEMTSDGVAIRDSRDLDIGVELMRIGVPPAMVLDEYEHLQKVMDDIARRFADLFETYVLPGEDDPSEKLNELVRLARSVVEMTLIRSLKREGQRRLA